MYYGYFSYLNQKKKRLYSIYQNSKIMSSLKFLLVPFWAQGKQAKYIKICGMPRSLVRFLIYRWPLEKSSKLIRNFCYVFLKSRRSVIIQLTLRKSLNETWNSLKQNKPIALSIFSYTLIFFLLLTTIKNSLVPMSLCCKSHAGPLSYSVPCYLKLRANGRNNSQHYWTNNVGRCWVRVGDGVQTDATTPNNVGTCSASWEGYNP